MEKNEREIYLINKSVTNMLSDSESVELKNLIDNGNISVEELEDYKIIWKLTRTIDLPEFNSKKAFKLIHRKNHPEIKNGKKLVVRMLKFAAVVIFGIFLGVLLNKYFLYEKNKFVEIETKKGDKIHIKLAEGNEVWLNSRSKIRYPANFTGANRYIELTGEAYFNLQSHGYNPVVIKCNGTKIVGTQAKFNARTNPEVHNTQITVESGWISISDPMWDNEQIVLEEGFKGTVDMQLPLLIEQNKNQNFLAWKTGKLVFDKMPLLKVAETLSDAYGIDIQIKGDVQYCTYTHSYNNNDIDKILNDLKNQFKTSISRENDLIIIRGSSCNI